MGTADLPLITQKFRSFYSAPTMGRIGAIAIASVDRFALSREFSMLQQIDEIRRIEDADELRMLAINLLRLNRGLRESLAVMVREEIPEIKLPDL
jgi:HAMP domain-containing protein